MSDIAWYAVVKPIREDLHHRANLHVAKHKDGSWSFTVNFVRPLRLVGVTPHHFTVIGYRIAGPVEGNGWRFDHDGDGNARVTVGDQIYTYRPPNVRLAMKRVEVKIGCA